MSSVVRLLQFGRRSLLPAVAFLLFSLVNAADLSAQAQATTGIIRGIVRDPAGAGVAGASVIMEHRETGLRAEVATTSSGAFIRTLLPVGTYDVTAKALGQYGDERIEGLVLTVGTTLNLVLEFKPVVLAEITVTGEKPLVDPQDVTQAQRLSAEVVDGLPNNGRNFLEYTLLTPGVQISQGPDGNVLNISGQRGIFNNVMVDGADFNNPFFGEQRGGQRPAFTFNQDAVQELVVVSQGAPAEFGRSSGGFVTVITKSGTNEFLGSAHYFGLFDSFAADFPTSRGGGSSDFTRHQFGLTLGGPLVRDKVFFFLSYDQQEGDETKQFTRTVINPSELAKLDNFLQSQWPGLFDNEFGPIERTDDNRALIAKFDVNLSDKHRASLKYNYTWSEQINGTFDVDAWGASSNGSEKDFSHAVNGALNSQLSNTLSNEFRFQYAREDRPRTYDGPIFPGGDIPVQPAFEGQKPFPDVGMDFADGFRIGLPFFLPIDPGFDTRIQLVDNISKLSGDHLFKFGVEYNRTRVEQQFVGFANTRYIFSSVQGFIDYVETGDKDNIVLFLQSAAIPPTPQEDLGLQSFSVNEVGVFLQDTWNPSEKLTLNLGVRWEGTWHPDMIIDPEDTFFATFLDDPLFPSDGTIPDDLNNWQPRFGLAYDVNGDGETVFRLNAGSYFSRIPMLVFAQHRTTNGAFQSILAASGSNFDNFGDIPDAFGELLQPTGTPFLTDIQVASRDVQLPRTWSFSVGFEKKLNDDVAIEISGQHARTDGLFRFANRNASELGEPFGFGTHPGGGGILALTTAESTARSRYSAVTLGLKGRNAFNDLLTFEANWTIARDKSDDDNERDPFTIRIADHTNLDAEYGWSDRDRRHSVNGYALFHLPHGISLNNVIRYATSSPLSENCSSPGTRAGSPADRICADGSVLERNTLRRENEIFTWDLRLSKVFQMGSGSSIEPIFEVFNLTDTDNFLDASQGGLLFNFDGTIRDGRGDTRRAQLGIKYRF